MAGNLLADYQLFILPLRPDSLSGLSVDLIESGALNPIVNY